MKKLKTLGVLLIIISNLKICFAGGPVSPYSFIENKGQLPKEVLFVAPIPGGKLFLKEKSLHYIFYDAAAVGAKHHKPKAENTITNIASRIIPGKAESNLIQMHGVEIKINNINPEVSLKSEGAKDQYYNYFTGKSRSGNAKAYESITYSNIYQGIDLKLYSLPTSLKYDLLLSPHAKASQISLLYEGATSLTISDGNLLVKTSVNTFIEQKPFAYQLNGKDTIIVNCEFRLNGNEVSFAFPRGYNKRKALIIDPILIFSTYSGSFADNWGFTATYGENGTLYFGGNVFDTGYRATIGAFQSSFAGKIDVVIMKMDSSGNNVLWASYLGGSSVESPHSLVINAKNELLVMGTTSSLDFPVSTGAYDPTFNGGSQVILDDTIDYENGSDIFISKISQDGSTLVSSTYLGGSGNDGIMVQEDPLYWFYGDSFRGDILSDNTGDVYITSYTNSINFPTKNGFQSGYGGGSLDGLVVKLNEDLSDIIWSSYLGGSMIDGAYSLKIDDLLNVYIGGGTRSSNFNVTTDAINPSYLGNGDGFIAKIKSDGSAILQSTFLGTTNLDQVYFIEIDKDKNVYALGLTFGSYLITSNVFSTLNGGLFLHGLNNNLNSTLFSTVYGNSNLGPDIRPTAFLVSDCENIYITGWGNTSTLPISSDAFQKTTYDEDFHMLVLSKNAEKMLYGTYFGGRHPRGFDHVDGGTSRFDKKGIVYHAVCGGCLAGYNASTRPSFPVTPNAPYPTVNSYNCNMAAFKFDLSTVNAEFDIIDKTGCNFPFTIAINNTSSGGVNYLWDFGDGTSSTDYEIDSHVYTKPGQYTITLQASSAENCGNKIDMTSQTINVYSTDFSIGAGAEICSGENFQLKAGGGIDYVWTPANTLSNNSVPNPIAQPQITTLYKVTITDANTCQHKDSILVKVINSVEIDFENTYMFNCQNSSKFQFTNKSKYANKYLWDFGDGTTSTEENPVHEYVLDSVYQVKLIASGNLCSAEKTIALPVIKTFVPNVFTPNGDSKNDFFEIKTQEPIQLLIYNRWGKELYKSDAYKNNWNANNLPTGIYFYTITDNKNNQCKGWVQVLR